MGMTGIDGLNEGIISMQSDDSATLQKRYQP